MSYQEAIEFINSYLSPKEIAKAFLHEEITAESLEPFLSGNVEDRKKFYFEVLDDSSKIPFFAKNLNRFNLTRDERAKALGAFLAYAAYTVSALDKIDDFLDESSFEWNDDAIDAVFGNDKEFLNQLEESVEKKSYDAPAASILALRNALTGEHRAEEALENYHTLKGTEKAAEELAKVADVYNKAQEDLGSFMYEIQINEDALEPEVPETEMEDAEDAPVYDVEVSDEFEADPFGFTPEEEVSFGWREAKPEVEGTLFKTGNLKVESLRAQKVTSSMILDGLKTETKAEYSLDDIRATMSKRRDQLLSYVYGKGEPDAAFTCLLDKNALKNNVIRFDDKKKAAMLRDLSDANIEKAARAVWGEKEPYDSFDYTLNANGLDEPNAAPDPDQLNTLKDNLMEMKELHACRSIGYFFRHPINFIKEARSISKAQDTMVNRFHVDPAELEFSFPAVNAPEPEATVPAEVVNEPVTENFTVPEAVESEPVMTDVKSKTEKTEVLVGSDPEKDGPAAE